MRLRRAEDLLAACLPADFEVLTLAPLVPLGTHSALGPVSQDKVVTAMRACETAADPTNALALEAAVRRIANRAGPVRLAAFQRVVRAQQLRPGYLAHFSLLGLVTAGRDDGGHRFEREAVAEHVRAVAAGLAAAGFAPGPAGADAAHAGRAGDRGRGRRLARGQSGAGTGGGRLRQRPPDRPWLLPRAVLQDQRHGAGAEWAEVGDGGFTDWAARLTASNKERLLISGVGIDRVAALGFEVP